jgi:hypothetical protein
VKTADSSLLADIREVNLSYLLLAQRMLRDDYAASMFRLGFSNEVADILMRLSPAQLVKLASSSSLLCRFRFDDYSLLSALTQDVLGGALQQVADALPAFGIVAAVLGVIKALAAVDQPPAVLGDLISKAMVGTFLGVLLAYGFVAPLASRVERRTSESVKVLECIKVTLLASMNGYPPQLAVEFGRKVLFSAVRPSFGELEEHVRQAKTTATGRA